MGNASPCEQLGEAVCQNDLHALQGRYHSSRRLEQDVRLESQVLGAGMSGEVFLATRHATSKQCAVKTLKKRHLNETRRAALMNELELHLSLDHPNVARLEQFFEDEENVYLVLEHLEGGELFERLSERQRFSENEACDALQQMLTAVAYLHSRRIVHRDLKFENFMFERQDCNQLKVIDFGLARRMGPAEEALSSICGSRDYLAPEVLGKSYTMKADIWALGIMTYTLLCGNFPWSGSDAEMLSSIRAGRPYYCPALFEPLSASAKDFVRALLTPNPSSRPSALAALDHEWVVCRKREPQALEPALMQTLRTYADVSPARRACLRKAAWTLPVREQAKLREQFDALGGSAAGTVCLDDFRRAVAALGVSVAEANCLFLSLDVDGSGELEYGELVAAVLQDPTYSEPDVVNLAFSPFDFDSHNSIDVSPAVAAKTPRTKIAARPCFLRSWIGFCSWCR